MGLHDAQLRFRAELDGAVGHVGHLDQQAAYALAIGADPREVAAALTADRPHFPAAPGGGVWIDPKILSY